MKISAQDLACFLYGVSEREILAAVFRPDGGLSVVVDRGIAGAPKYVLTAQETAQAQARAATPGNVKTAQEQRETFTGAPLAQGPTGQQTKPSTTRKRTGRS